MTILFAGSNADISLNVFQGVLKHIPVRLLITREDKAAGRGRRLSSSPLAEIAQKEGIPVFQPARLDESARLVIAACKPDILLCTAYGKILGSSFLSLFPNGAVNVHPSLLPRYRGPSPIQSCILNGDTVTGVSIHYMVKEVDAGDIIEQEEVALNGRESSTELSLMLSDNAVRLLVKAVQDIAANRHKPRKQNEEQVVYCSSIRKEDGRINWNMPAAYIDRMMRAYTPWPGVFAMFNNTLLKLHAGKVMPYSQYTEGKGSAEAAVPGTVLGYIKKQGILIATTQDLLLISRLQLAGRKALQWEDFLRGVDNFINTMLL